MKGKSTGIVEKGLDTICAMLGTVVPYYITVINQRQDVRLEVRTRRERRRNQERCMWKFTLVDTMVTTWLMWSDQVKVSFTTTPRSLKLSTCSI